MTFNRNQPGKEQVLNQLDHTMGHIRGKIIDINGKTIEGSKILIRETGQSIYSDNQGNFVLINIPPALYTVAIEHEGYALSVMPDLPVLIGDNPGHIFVLCTSNIPEKLNRVYFSNEFVMQM
ncbi:MAG TPA: hypothetical protein DCO75_00355 [Fibrobacteres bacterium]|jgi:hypothetical protein|nr:hypothetical protein [Fibrobacterota bacterium]